MFIILIATIYDPPEKDGYCKDSSTTSDAPHEYCKCDSANDSATALVCYSYCNVDADCKGYDFKQTWKYCRMFTTASCPIGCNNGLKERVGNVGSLVIYPSPDIRCFIKG